MSNITPDASTLTTQMQPNTGDELLLKLRQQVNFLFDRLDHVKIGFLGNEELKIALKCFRVEPSEDRLHEIFSTNSKPLIERVDGLTSRQHYAQRCMGRLVISRTEFYQAFEELLLERYGE